VIRNAILISLVAAFSASASDSTRLARSTNALRTFEQKAPAVALDLLQKSLCVGVVPHSEPDDTGGPGQGVVSCRETLSSRWSAPAGIQISGGGMIWDLALTRMDVVWAVNARGALKGFSKTPVLFGVDFPAYPGPLRAASASDIPIGDGIFAWSISTAEIGTGDVEPVALGGGVLNENSDLNLQIYGSKLRNQTILAGSELVKNAPGEVRDFTAALGMQRPEVPVPATGTASAW
jgi:lipid-binding SYLF domain-containing protein